MDKRIKQTLKGISWLLIGIVVVLAILLAGMRLLGLQIYTVLSPSMEPDYPTGSLIYVKDVDPADLQVNDVITFTLTGGTTATHRIIELVPDETDPTVTRFRTKGDNNDIPDGGLVEYADIIGVPVFVIPYLGYLATYIQHPPGSILAVTAAVVIVILVIMIDLITDDKKKKESSL